MLTSGIIAWLVENLIGLSGLESVNISYFTFDASIWIKAIEFLALKFVPQWFRLQPQNTGRSRCQIWSIEMEIQVDSTYLVKSEIFSSWFSKKRRMSDLVLEIEIKWIGLTSCYIRQTDPIHCISFDGDGLWLIPPFWHCTPIGEVYAIYNASAVLVMLWT